MGSGPQSKLLNAASASYTDFRPSLSISNRTYTNGTTLNGTAMSQEHCLALCYNNLCGGYVTYNETTQACAFRQPQPNPENVSVALYQTSPAQLPSQVLNSNLTYGGTTCDQRYNRTVSSTDACFTNLDPEDQAIARRFDYRLYNPRNRTCYLCRFTTENDTNFLIGVSPATAHSTIKPWVSFNDVSAKNQLDGSIIALEYDGKYVVANLNGDLGYIDKTWRYGETTGLDMATKFQVRYSSNQANFFSMEPLFNTSKYLQYANPNNVVRWSPGRGENDPYSLFGVELEGTPSRIVRIIPAAPQLAGNFFTDYGNRRGIALGPIIWNPPEAVGRLGGILPVIIEESPYVKAYGSVNQAECCFGTYSPTSQEFKICQDLKVTPNSQACIGPDITHGVTGVIANYCSNRIGDDQRCLTFCKDKTVDCDNLIETYCQRIGPQQAASSDICGCFRGVDFYENFFNQLKSNVSLSPTYPDFPQCYYKRCATSSWQNYRTKSLGSQCPNITSCINVNEFNNVTGDIGSVTIDQTNECKSVQQNITPVTPVTAQVTITSVEPNFGPPAGGTNITINGSNFELGATVTIGGQVATSTWVSPTKFTAVTPAGTGTVNISITNPESTTGNLPDAFSYSTVPVLKITTVKPGSGLIGTVITLTGSNFQTGATVYFGDVVARETKVNNSTQITTTAPEGSGRVDVTVKNPGGQSFTLPQSFVYSTKPEPMPSPKKGIPWWVWLLVVFFILFIFIAILLALRRRRVRAHKLAIAPETPLLGSQSDVGF